MGPLLRADPHSAAGRNTQPSPTAPPPPHPPPPPPPRRPRSQPDSTKRSAHGTPFGSEPRGNSTSLPGYSRGPAQSAGEPGLGRPQVQSIRPNAARAHFGTSSRDHARIMYSAFTYKPQ
jgi:hypothetical protein